MTTFASDNDPLELIIKSRIKGATEANAAAAAASNMAVAENKAAKEAKTAIGVYERLAATEKELAKVRNGELKVGADRYKDLEAAAARYQKQIERMNRSPAAKPAPVYGVNGRLARVRSLLDDGGLSPEQTADLSAQEKRYQGAIDRMNRPAPSRGARIMQAILTSRFSAGGGPGGAGVQPLVGRTIAALGGEEAAATAGGPVGIALGAIALVGKVLFNLAEEASQLTQRFTDLRAQVGGTSTSVAQVAIMSRITGVDGGSAANALQGRITSDPMAMAYAARLGVHNIAGPFGNLDYGSQYQSLIERTAAVGDPNERRRLSSTLGISQEVERYALLSPQTRASLSGDASLTARVNNPDQERRAAEFSAAESRVSQAWDNLKTAAGTGIEDSFTSFLNNLADAMNVVTSIMAWANEKSSIINKVVGGLELLTGSSAGLITLAADHDKGAAGSAASVQSANTAAIMTSNTLTAENNDHLARLNGTLGGGDRAAGAVPSALRGGNLNRAVTLQALRLGSL